VDAGPHADFHSSDHEVARAIGWHGSPRGFWEYLPPSAAAGPSPLLIAFHGIDENGDGSLAALTRLQRNGPPRFIHEDAWPADRPFIVLSPQNASGCPSATGVAAFLAWAIGEYDVDPDRIYLTGLSCGAIGVANYMRANVTTTTVAAVVTIAGDWRSAWSTQMCELGRVPLWAIHGDSDTRAGALSAYTEVPITSLLACPRPPRRDVVLTMLPGVGHSDRAWDDTYSGANGLDIYTWMLDHPRAP
jgi:poly(3-hydroxybutyrate) depolymerase